VHHDLSWGLDLLETVQCDVIKVTSAVEISLLISHYLFEEAVTSSFSLFLLKKKIVC
jgi:hypothetical protein